MVLGDAVTKLQRFVWIFNHVSRVRTWSLFNLRAPNLVKWPISTWPFIWWCQFIDYLFKFETRPSSLRNSEMANRWFWTFFDAWISILQARRMIYQLDFLLKWTLWSRRILWFKDIHAFRFPPLCRYFCNKIRFTL